MEKWPQILVSDLFTVGYAVLGLALLDVDIDVYKVLGVISLVWAVQCGLKRSWDY